MADHIEHPCRKCGSLLHYKDGLCGACFKRLSEEVQAENVCEHGDHPAPEGKRFCSEACERCEHESAHGGCDGICGLDQEQ